MSALINAFIHSLLQNIKMEDQLFLAVRAVIEKISNHFYNSDLDLHALLTESGYAEDYIGAQFKKILNKTPTQFLTEIRINHACFLINTCKNTLSLSDIAEKCGYTDYAYFSRRFKYITGSSPRAFMENS